MLRLGREPLLYYFSSKDDLERGKEESSNGVIEQVLLNKKKTGECEKISIVQISGFDRAKMRYINDNHGNHENKTLNGISEILLSILFLTNTISI